MMDRAKAIEIVRNLRARAESTGFPAEADTCRRQADRLVERHSLADHELVTPSPEMPPPDGTVVGRHPSGFPIVIINGVPHVIVQFLNVRVTHGYSTQTTGTYTNMGYW